MCLDSINRKAKKPKKIVGYRAAMNHGDGLFGPIHQNEYIRFRVGSEVNYYTGDGFHIFFKAGAAFAYAESQGYDNVVVLEVECTNIMQIGRHDSGDGYGEAFTCKDMKVLSVVKDKPPKTVKKYDHDWNCGQSAHWINGGGRVTVNAKNIQKGICIDVFSYPDSGQTYALVADDKNENNVIIPVEWVYTPVEAYV